MEKESECDTCGIIGYEKLSTNRAGNFCVKCLNTEFLNKYAHISPLKTSNINHSSSNPKRRRRGKRNKNTRHMRFLSPHLHAFMDDDTLSDTASDIISTLSTTDYTSVLDECDEGSKQYINIFNNKENDNTNNNDHIHVPLRLRSHSYRFPGLNTRYSVVDCLAILDDNILSQLNEKQKFTQSEMEMRYILISILREMDVIGEGRLDIADFISVIMNTFDDYDDIMEHAESLFANMEHMQDDMDTINIEDIVDAIILNKDDAATRIKQEIVIGLQLNVASDNDEYNNKAIQDLEDIMPKLNVKPMERDPNQERMKPIYQTTNAIQKI